MKVREGQVEFLQMVAELAGHNRSLASEIIRVYVDKLTQGQALAPDVVPSEVHMTPDIDGDTGKLVKYKT